MVFLQHCTIYKSLTTTVARHPAAVANFLDLHIAHVQLQTLLLHLLLLPLDLLFLKLPVVLLHLLHGPEGAAIGGEVEGAGGGGAGKHLGPLAHPLPATGNLLGAQVAHPSCLTVNAQLRETECDKGENMGAVMFL